MPLTRVPSATHHEARGITLFDQFPQTATRQVVQVNDVELGYSVIDPTVDKVGTALLVAGYTSSYDTFNCILTPLAERGYRVIGLSQRGQPHSSGPDDENAYKLDQLGRDILTLLDTLDIGEPVHLLGHSFGGVVAAEAALADPSRFASVTFWNSGPRAMAEGQVAYDALRRGGPRELWLLDCERAGIDPDGDLNVIEQYYHDRLMGTNPSQLVAGAAILRDQTDRTAELAATGLRFLVSHGAHDDAWPIEWQRTMAEQLQADYVVLAHAGHSAHGDRPNLTSDVLAGFWSDGGDATS